MKLFNYNYTLFLYLFIVLPLKEHMWQKIRIFLNWLNDLPLYHIYSRFKLNLNSLRHFNRTCNNQWFILKYRNSFNLNYGLKWHRRPRQHIFKLICKTNERTTALQVWSGRGSIAVYTVNQSQTFWSRLADDLLQVIINPKYPNMFWVFFTSFNFDCCTFTIKYLNITDN